MRGAGAEPQLSAAKLSHTYNEYHTAPPKPEGKLRATPVESPRTSQDDEKVPPGVSEKSIARLNESMTMTPYELCEQVEGRLGDHRFMSEARDAYLNDKHEPVWITGDVWDEIGVVQPQDIGWWTVVPENPDDPDIGETADYETIGPTSLLGGNYVLLHQSDVVDAVAYFVAQCVLKMPETRNAEYYELHQRLKGTFREFREKGVVGHAWDWGQFLYTTYGWTTTAVDIYRDPAMALLVLRALKRVGAILLWLVI